MQKYSATGDQVVRKWPGDDPRSAQVAENPPSRRPSGQKVAGQTGEAGDQVVREWSEKTGQAGDQVGKKWPETGRVTARMVQNAGRDVV